MKNEKNMEEFKKNLESHNFSAKFIQLALNYFKELHEEMEVNYYEDFKFNSIEDVIDFYAKSLSFTWDTFSSENNLKDLREDLYLLYVKDSNNFLEFNLYFENIEMFEIYVLYTLYFEFYPQEVL